MADFSGPCARCSNGDSPGAILEDTRCRFYLPSPVNVRVSHDACAITRPNDLPNILSPREIPFETRAQGFSIRGTKISNAGRDIVDGRLVSKIGFLRSSTKTVEDKNKNSKIPIETTEKCFFWDSSDIGNLVRLKFDRGK